MKFGKENEQGFLLLESLVTLSLIASIIFFIYPPLVEWINIRHDAKTDVELSRVFYESSVNWKRDSPKNENDSQN